VNNCNGENTPNHPQIISLDEILSDNPGNTATALYFKMQNGKLFQ